MKPKIRSALSALLALPRTTRKRVPLALLVLLSVEISRPLLGFPRTLRILGLSLHDRRTGLDDATIHPVDVLDSRERSVVEAVEFVVKARPVDGRCLRRAMMLGWLLRSRSPVLRIGVEREAGVVSAHAWIEIDGQPVAAGDGLERFAPLGRARPSIS